MTKPLLAILLLTTTLSASAEDLKPWRCVTDRTVGVDVSDDFRPTNFIDKPEFRIVPASTLLAKVKAKGDEFAVSHLREDIARQDKDAVAFIRRVEDSPDNVFLWMPCAVSIYGADPSLTNPSVTDSPYNYYECKYVIGGLELFFQTTTRRFYTIGGTDWIYGDEGSMGGEAGDAAFGFGTCTPYYD